MKVHVIYDTKRGATERVAGWIGNAMKEMGAEVEVKRAGDVKEIDGELVVIGSPVYWERPLRSVRDFVKSRKEELARKKLAFFVVCMAGEFAGKRYLKSLMDGLEDMTVARCVFRGWLWRVVSHKRERVEKWARDVLKGVKKREV